VREGGADAASVGTLDATSLAVKFADAIIARWPNATQIDGANAFEYNVGIVLRGIEAVYQRTGDVRYRNYIQKYVDSFIDDSGTLNIPTGHSFDNIQPSVLFFLLSREVGTAKYAMAATKVRAMYDTWPRNAEQGFWHKDQYPNEMWLDSIYMGEVFLARYGATASLNCGSFCFDTVGQQMTLLATHVRDTATGLLYHAWDQDKNATWADPSTGRSPVIWGRALGWYAMSLVDNLDLMPSTHPSYAPLLDILKGLAVGLKNTQDSKTGLWYQVVDQGTKSDNWLETSGSGMFVYALKLGMQHGYLDSSYTQVANLGWQGMQSKVTMTSGRPSITGAVQGMGVQNDYANYVNKMQLTDSPHGLCAILLSAAVMEAK
jgi:unsaturated rhamnogalacturonyl hydrolase